MADNRDLVDVIDRMLELIPDSEHDLRKKLASVQDSAHYTPPDGMAIRWEQLLKVLWNNLGAPVAGWQVQVARLFGGPR